MKKLLLIGEKINESLSPEMHNAALKHLGLDADYRYELFPVKRENFDAEMKKLKSDKDLAGFNVTMPYKTDILKFVDETDSFTRKCGACNYVKVEKGLWSGKNTDGYGFIMPLAKRNIAVKGSTVLFFGAGGAARAAILQCINNGCEQIIVINRTPERAVNLRKQILTATGLEPNNFLIYTYNELKNNELRCIILDEGVISIRDLIAVSRVIVNATPVFAEGGDLPFDFPPEIFNKNQVIYDISYCDNVKSGLFKSAKDSGCLLLRGHEMLAYQGFMSFFSWTSKKPPISIFMNAAEKK